MIRIIGDSNHTLCDSNVRRAAAKILDKLFRPIDDNTATCLPENFCNITDPGLREYYENCIVTDHVPERLQRFFNFMCGYIFGQYNPVLVLGLPKCPYIYNSPKQGPEEPYCFIKEIKDENAPSFGVCYAHPNPDQRRRAIAHIISAMFQWELYFRSVKNGLSIPIPLEYIDFTFPDEIKNFHCNVIIKNIEYDIELLRNIFQDTLSMLNTIEETPGFSLVEFPSPGTLIPQNKTYDQNACMSEALSPQPSPFFPPNGIEFVDHSILSNITRTPSIRTEATSPLSPQPSPVESSATSSPDIKDAVVVSPLSPVSALAASSYSTGSLGAEASSPKPFTHDPMLRT